MLNSENHFTVAKYQKASWCRGYVRNMLNNLSISVFCVRNDTATQFTCCRGFLGEWPFVRRMICQGWILPATKQTMRVLFVKKEMCDGDDDDDEEGLNS
jgi:hypothetical protein